jgi:Ca2+-transporting ATPase
MWFARSKQAALDALQVSPSAGLSQAEAASRLRQYGENKLEGKPKKTLIALFLAQLKDMLIYVLIGAAVVTLLIGEYVDAVIILLVVILNAVIGVVQEYKAEKAIEALQRMTTPHALVRRNGQVAEIRSEEIVPGDIVLLDAGRYVPADLRLIDSANLQIDESALTGESVPAGKDADAVFADPSTPLGDRANMAFMSTLVTYGRGEGVAVATGMNTEIGKIARTLDEDEPGLTPLQQRLAQLGKTLGWIAIGICALIFLIALIQRRDLFEMFLTAISLAVAAIPEGLPAIVAIVLALGVTRMSRNHAIVKKLPAVETLGSVTVICSDKTGTLTQNKMTVVKFHTVGRTGDVPADGTEVRAEGDARRLVEALVLCADATYDPTSGGGTGDPTEIALVAWGYRAGMPKPKLNAACPRVGEKPFDSARKLMSTLNRTAHGYRVHTKGALDRLLPICDSALVNGETVPLTAAMKDELMRTAEAMADEALRILGAACKGAERPLGPEEMESGLTFIGLVGMIDPPRLEVKDAIAEAKRAGITPVMITGDHRNTATAISRELGIADSPDQSITGAEIDALSEEDFARRVRELRVFARVSPEHKVKIVRAFQAHGHIVSMTGDGVNDAPSLKFSDIGVAMGVTGTDVAKGASDMILTDDNFTTIVKAIREGRAIYQNIKKSVLFLLSCNLGEVAVILVAVLFFWPLPLLPTQILWINLITDTLPAIALGVDPGEKDVMKRKPRDPQESFFAHGAGFRAVLGGLLIGAITLLAFWLGLREFGYGLRSAAIPDEVMAGARTMAFVVLAASQLFYSLAMRDARRSIFRIGVFTNRKLVGAIALGLLLQVAVISVPVLADAFNLRFLTWNDWLAVIVLSLFPLAANEAVKYALRRFRRPV